MACEKSDNNTDKGNIFEDLAEKLLKAQGYVVTKQVRCTAVELDLLCKHKTNGKEIYVECKAHNNTIQSGVLKELLGTIALKNFNEGWIISTSEFGKDAKGFVQEWQKKPSDQSSKLSFYTPNLVIDALKNTSIIIREPTDKAKNHLHKGQSLGDCILLVTRNSLYWAMFVVEHGHPFGVLIYDAKTGEHIQNENTLDYIAQLNTSLKDLNIFFGQSDETTKIDNVTMEDALPNVVEVQIGDSWEDYRPARPKDFIGRHELQNKILIFIRNTNKNQGASRIFAIKGNSGIGKSSLIAKIRDRSKNKHYRNKCFIYAVDMRGAKTASYINASLLKCLQESQKAGFGEKNLKLQLTDPASPFASQTIAKYFLSLKKKRQVVCLIFDQFEELYSKPELFKIFESARSLMLATVTVKENFTLGFAWKTDSTTQQDHPAYSMWHELSDYRKTYKLDIFDGGEISKTITTFEKETGQKVRKDLRHQIIYNCQGFPWLLKKLCISLYENLKSGKSSEYMLANLDVKQLFETDLENLSQKESNCLNYVAIHAPADYSEVIERFGRTLNCLINKRLVIKSGERLNIYWDIFKDYLLTKKTPIIPFNYIPLSNLTTILKTSALLKASKFLTLDSIAKKMNLKKQTMFNVVSDLTMFGIAESNTKGYRLHKNLNKLKNNPFLKTLREKFNGHSLKIMLYKNYINEYVDSNILIKLLKQTSSKVNYANKTWRTYAQRILQFLIATGFLIGTDGNKYKVCDVGNPIDNAAALLSFCKRGRQNKLFLPATSPSKALETLKLIKNNPRKIKDLQSGSHRNALYILRRFGLIITCKNKFHINTKRINKRSNLLKIIFLTAKNEWIFEECAKKIKTCPTISGIQLGQYIADTYNLQWAASSQKRHGNALLQWVKWIILNTKSSKIAKPPGRG